VNPAPPPKPTLYIGLDGPVLIPSGDIDPFLKAAIAIYAKPFMHWAVGHFNVRWLSRRSSREAFYVAGHLGLPEDAIPVAGFRLIRCEAIPGGENLFWIDGPLTAAETSWLWARRSARFFGVDPLIGVTPTHKRALENLILKGGRP
jgi:hypothetical protein